MRKTVEKTIMTIDALNILNWLEQPDGFMSKVKLPIQVMWDLKDNIRFLTAIREKYHEFYPEIEKKYSDDAHSYEFEQKEENGEMTIVRRVKDEFMEAFNKEKYDLLISETKYPVKVFNIEEFGDVEVGIQDMNMLSFFMEEQQ